LAELHPFRAYRYNRTQAGDLDRLVTQPYDKISPELQQDYYRRSPYNVARITKSLEKTVNPDTDYSEASSTMQGWIRDSVLIQDPEPAIYVYYQYYEVEGKAEVRRGFMALLDLKHSGSGVLAHERTMAEPKEDRLRLMRATECNEDLIFMLYTDDKVAVNGMLDEAASLSHPEIDVSDDFGVKHRVWIVTNPAVIKKIAESMVPEELFIADGHHRFETSVNFMKECKASGFKPAGIESFDKRLVACFNSADRGITILPTHRLIRDLPEFNSRDFLGEAKRFFEIESVASSALLWEKMMAGRSSSHVFGFYPGDTRSFSLLRLKEEAKVDPFMLSHPEAYRHLDVSILHTLILNRLLGIDEGKLVAQAHVDYARDREACIRRVDDERYQAAFFLNPTSVEQVQRIAVLGERMPQKSTDFYPKLLTGLVFMKMEIAKTSKPQPRRYKGTKKH
jgi:uncharacterized protein (DUF1015 family)